jgi:hypothetical protein
MEDRMEHKWLSVGVVSLLLAVSPPTWANVVGVLENPAAGQPGQSVPVSGITAISGWAFTEDSEEDLTIELRIDGRTRDDLDVPCCGQRDDVNEMVAGAPPDTGFGALFNYGILSAGPHTIGVDIRSSDFVDDITNSQDRLVIDRSIVVARPGNVEVLTAADLSGATCSVAAADNEIVIDNVQLTSSGGTATTTLRAAYTPSTQSFVITDSSDLPAQTSFVAHLTGAQEVPRVQTSATGEAVLTLGATDNSLACAVNTTDLSDATMAHIHLAPAGENGDIIVNLAGGPPTWSCPPGTSLTPEQVTALREARLYVNVHSQEHQNGEVRGQVVAP